MTNFLLDPDYRKSLEARLKAGERIILPNHPPNPLPAGQHNVPLQLSPPKGDEGEKKA